MNTEFIIAPYIGVEPLRFGMSRQEVEQLLGPPEHCDWKANGGLSEGRQDMVVQYDAVDMVVGEIGFGRRAKVRLFDCEIFTSEDPVRCLMRYDSKPFEVLGVLVFLELGISIGGFHNREESEKAVTAFRRGYWDVVREHFVPYRPVLGDC